MMLAHAKPMPIMGINNSAAEWISGINSMPIPAIVKQAACMIFGPKRRVKGINKNADKKATQL